MNKATKSHGVDPNAWHFVDSKNYPSRYGMIVIDDEMMGGLHRYSIKLNNQQFLSANNQPAELSVSKIFELKNEDAFVITALRGDKSCVYKNYLVTLHAGAAPTVREFKSCSPSNEVHQAFDALFVRFAGAMNNGVYDSWDVWRYENANLQRM